MPTALIVEDEPEANQLLSMLVRLRGFETESAFSGGEALDKADRRRPDIMFLDLMLPDITGYDVCTSIKSRRATHGIPVVMVTARLAAENRRKGFRLGANEYIPKPYTPDQIFRAIADAHDWRRRIDDHSSEGSFAIESADDIGPFQQLNDLRTLLLSRSPISEGAIGSMTQSLAELVQRSLDWGRRHKAVKIADVAYRLDGARFALTIQDDAGWFQEDHPDENGMAKAIETGRFGHVDFDAVASRVTLTAAFHD